MALFNWLCAYVVANLFWGVVLTSPEDSGRYGLKLITPGVEPTIEYVKKR